jgi:two-component system, NtrC family, response regulator AtoC
MAMRELSRRALSNPAAIRLLVVSREPAALSMLWAMGEANGWEIELTNSGCEALERVQPGNGPDLVVLDLARGDADGLYTLRWLRRVRPDVRVILLAHAEDATQKMEAMRLGACEYLVRPIEERVLASAIRLQLKPAVDAAQSEVAGEKVMQIGEGIFFVASSPVMRKLRAQAELLAQVDVPVLIVGESGSGKEATARLIHKLSVRSGFRFRRVDCAALPGDLLEHELFGHEPAASPGATNNGEGKVELSEKGTLLLDDIAEAPANLQGKLLQVLQEKQFVRLGGQGRVDVDVRIMATAEGNLEDALREKKLREDLYYRLSAFTVQVPPLRQRREEIPLLLGYCMNQMARRYGLPTRTFTSAVLEACQTHLWPGNLRELETFVKSYLVMGGDEELALSELGQSWDARTGRAALALEGDSANHRETAEFDDHTSGLRSLVQSVKGETERGAIAAALEQTHWNRKAAARLLKVSYRTLLYKIQQYQMSPPPGYLSSAMLGQGAKGNGSEG